MFSSVIIAFFFLFYVSAQFHASGKVINTLFGLSSINGIILGAIYAFLPNDFHEITELKKIIVEGNIDNLMALSIFKKLSKPLYIFNEKVLKNILFKNKKIKTHKLCFFI